MLNDTNIMKVIFTHGYYIEEDEKEQLIMRPYPPLGILYLSAWLEKNGVDNSVYDTTFSNKSKCYDHLTSEKPDVLAIYTNLMTKLNVIEMIKFVRSQKELKQCKIILGGPDVRHNKIDYLSTGADIVVVGEGEETMLEIVQTIQKGNLHEFGHVSGLAYISDGGDIISTVERKKIKDVNLLPFPNRKKIDVQAYLATWKKHHGASAMTVSTQRGCPYTCKWCSTAVYGQSYRRRSPKLVAEELKHIKETYNPDTIWFVDDVFTVSHKWLAEFVKEVNELDAIIPFECITRADRMNEDVVSMLKESGAFRIWIGAESGSQKIIDLMDRRVDIQKVRDMIHLTRDYGMKTGTFIMLGYPGETEEDIIATANHLKDCNPDEFTITVAYPIKGTSLYNEVESLQIEELDWQKTTDRDREFERTYPRGYYSYAVKWVNNEVRGYKEKMKDNVNPIKVLKYKLKTLILRMFMYVAKRDLI